MQIHLDRKAQIARSATEFQFIIINIPTPILFKGLFIHMLSILKHYHVRFIKSLRQKTSFLHNFTFFPIHIIHASRFKWSHKSEEKSQLKFSYVKNLHFLFYIMSFLLTLKFGLLCSIKLKCKVVVDEWMNLLTTFFLFIVFVL
jgi:hypothetical protein